MSFQLLIRDNLKEEAAGFAPSETAAFETAPVLAGTDKSCHCQIIEDEKDAPSAVWFRIKQREDNFILSLENPPDLFLNNREISESEVTLTSGDEIRVGHWTFRFRKMHEKPQFSPGAEWTARLWKSTIVVLIIIQLLIALWLPGKLQYKTIAGTAKINEEKAAWALDLLQSRIAGMLAANEKLTPRKALLLIIEEELNKTASYIRQYRNVISPEDWKYMKEDLQMYRQLLDDIEHHGKVPKEIPDPAVETGLRQIIFTPGQKQKKGD